MHQAPGWCEAAAGSTTPVAGNTKCPCYDGQGGALCEKQVPAFCLRHCSGNGQCDMGFCLCKPGCFGADCGQCVDPSSGYVKPAQVRLLVLRGSVRAQLE